MGTNKLLLPFGEHTVLGQIIAVLQACPLDEIIVVTGHEQERIQETLGRHHPGGLRFVYNLNYAAGEMLSSIQTGLAAISGDCDAALVALGDQPQIERRIVEQILAAHDQQEGAVVIPSFNRRGGHPILVKRACWPEILALPSGANLRDMLRAHADWVRYVAVDTPSILRDLDTPEDYYAATSKRQEFNRQQ